MSAGVLAGCTEIHDEFDARENPQDEGETDEEHGDEDDGGDTDDEQDGNDGHDWHEDALVFEAGPPISLEPIVEGIEAPVGMEYPGEDSERTYIVTQPGRIVVHGPDGLEEEPFLDVSDELVDNLQDIIEEKEYLWYDERGLLGLEFHPDFESNGRFFVRYSSQRREGTPKEFDHTDVLAEYRATDDNRVADPQSERIILETPQPDPIHSAGAIQFGPDGYLYTSYGDGGFDGGPSQDTENRHGSIVRIDVDAKDEPYAVPDDNPLVGEEGLDEIYAWGFRNPWRMSFDSDGRLFVGDVGEQLYESVNLVEKGGNYGWNIREGTSCFNPEDPITPKDECPDETPDGEPFLDPIVEYPRQLDGGFVGNAVIGGIMYESDTISELTGKYVFGDFNGRIFTAHEPGGEGDAWVVRELPISGIEASTLLETDDHIFSFGRDADGELYVLTTHTPDQMTEESGVVYRVDAPS